MPVQVSTGKYLQAKSVNECCVTYIKEIVVYKYLFLWKWIQTARFSIKYYCSVHEVTLDSSAVTEEKPDTKLKIRPDHSEFGFYNPPWLFKLL